jgi:hypothetical protein
MALDTESFNKELYDLLKVRGYKPVPLNAQNQRVKASQEADVIEFQFIKDGKDYGKAWITLDDAQNVNVYFDDEQQDSPNNPTPGVEYDDTWTGFLKHVKQWAQRRQLSFELSNKDRLGDDMRQREYYKMKEKIAEGYHPMGKKASYNDAVPNVKIVIQHSRSLEEGEQRYRNVARIFLENQDGERFLAPTTRPGIARVYARHIAEGGVPNDDRWGHIKSICEEYNKMAGFVRATRSKQFNESAQALINEGVNHYNNLRETLSRMTGHRGYNAYFESWTPTLMEDEGDESINELFVQETVDPRIESVMPILSRLRKNVAEVKEVDALAEWAESVINEKLDAVPQPYKKAEKQDYDEQVKGSLTTTDPDLKKIEKVEEDDEDSTSHRYNTSLDPHTRAARYADSAKGGKSKLDPDTIADLIKFGVIMSEEELEEEESIKSNNPVGIPEGEELEEDLGPEQKRVGQLGPTEKVGPKGAVGKLVGASESKKNNDTPLVDKEDYVEKRKSLQKIQMDPDTAKDPKMKDELADRLHRLEQQAKEKGLKEGDQDLARLRTLIIR